MGARMAEGDMSEGVKIYYKGAIDNIIFLKRQQWIITNYALVVYAAVVTLSRGALHDEKWALCIIAAIAWVYGTWCLVHTQRTMTKLRKSMFHIYQTYFTEDQRKAFTLWDEQPNFNYTPEFIYGLIVAHITAFVVCVYSIWRGLPISLSFFGNS
jgi:hypothetical protein